MSAIGILRQLRETRLGPEATIVSMFDFDSPRFKRSLTETVAWCAARSLGANNADAAAMHTRRILFDQSTQLLKEAQAQAKHSWFRRKPTQTRQWHQAFVLLKQVRDSFGPLEHQLRSAALKPTFALNEFGMDAPWADAVAEVAAKRSHLMGETLLEGGADDEKHGRLLLFVPSETLADGAAQHSSNGFFDMNNVPPWDIWVGFSEGTLVSWVPPALMDAAQIGIDVNPEQCIRWAD
jgi:hypothetical protein